jgi:hypothetical protein
MGELFRAGDGRDVSASASIPRHLSTRERFDFWVLGTERFPRVAGVVVLWVAGSAPQTRIATGRVAADAPARAPSGVWVVVDADERVVERGRPTRASPFVKAEEAR